MIGLIEKVKLWNDSPSSNQKVVKAEEELDMREMSVTEEIDDSLMGSFIVCCHSLAGV